MSTFSSEEKLKTRIVDRKGSMKHPKRLHCEKCASLKDSELTRNHQSTQSVSVPLLGCRLQVCFNIVADTAKHIKVTLHNCCVIGQFQESKSRPPIPDRFLVLIVVNINIFTKIPSSTYFLGELIKDVKYCTEIVSDCNKICLVLYRDSVRF